MYLTTSELESGTLRQGDILSQVHIAGALNLTTVQIMRGLDGGPATGWAVPKAPDVGDVAVLSHSCEIATTNNVKVTSIILAPIRSVSKATSPDKIQELIDSNVIKPGTSASFLKYFYLEPDSALSDAEGGVIDFSKCFSVRKNCMDYLLGRKIIQLRPDIADAMALKVALYFYRNSPTASSVAPTLQVIR